MKRLYRSRSGRLLGGVAQGLAEYLDVDVAIMRLLFLLSVVVTPNFVLAYFLAWIIIPERPYAEKMPEKHKCQEVPPVSETGGGAAEKAISLENQVGDHERRKEWVGYALIALGAVFLFQKLAPRFFWMVPIGYLRQWWPVGIIALGILLVYGVIKG